MKFTSFDEVFADAENLAFSPNTRMLGHWQLGQLLAHLAWGHPCPLKGTGTILFGTSIALGIDG